MTTAFLGDVRLPPAGDKTQIEEVHVFPREQGPQTEPDRFAEVTLPGRAVRFTVGFQAAELIATCIAAQRSAGMPGALHLFAREVADQGLEEWQ